MNKLKEIYSKHPVYSWMIIIALILLASSLVPKKPYTKKYPINTQEGIVESKLNRAVLSHDFYDARGADLPNIFITDRTTDSQGYISGLIEINFYSPKFTYTRGVSALNLEEIFKSIGEIPFDEKEKKLVFLIKVWDDLVDLHGKESADVVLTTKLSVEHIKATNWDNLTEDRLFKLLSEYGSIWMHPAIAKFNKPE